MTEINWDEVAQDADESPRSVLAEALALADEIEDAVVVLRLTNGSMWLRSGVQSRAMTIGMLEWAKYVILQEVDPEL